MILSPFGPSRHLSLPSAPPADWTGPPSAVFLHTSPYPPVPELQESEVASAHWIPLDLLHAPAAKYGSVPIDIATRLAPRNRVARWVLHMLVGQMDFKCVSHCPLSHSRLND